MNVFSINLAAWLDVAKFETGVLLKPQTTPGPQTLFILGSLGCMFIAGILVSNSRTQGLLSLVGAMVLLGIAGWLVQQRGAETPDEEGTQKAAQFARERARAIAEMATTLGATLDYNKVLDTAMDAGVLGLKEVTSQNARLISMVLLFEKDHLRVATSRRMTQRDLSMTVPGQAGVLGKALQQAEPIIATNGAEDPELQYFAAFQDARSILAIPLRAGFQNYGLLVFGTPEPNAFSNEDADLLSAIGTQAMIALQNAVLYEKLREEKERIVAIEEDARKKLARDLHDGPVQSISAVAMRVNAVRRFVDNNPKVFSELEKVEDLARRTTKEIRHMLFTLRPLVLETQGLFAALSQLKQKFKETHDLDVLLQLQQGADEFLDTRAQGLLFYIVEEAVNNARKHAQAPHIYVRVYRRESNYVIVEIQDDGVGFDPKAVDSGYDQRGSLGMVNMNERAALIEGVLRIDSAKGKGTKISVLVPISRTNHETPLPSGGASRPEIQPGPVRRPAGGTSRLRPENK